MNRSDRRNGQSVAEFALVLPLLMLLLLIVIDFGRAYMGWVELNNAARVAANYAGQNPTASFGTGSTYATLTTTDASGSNCPLVSVPLPTFVGPSGTVAPSAAQLGDQAQVSLTCQFQMMLSAFPVFGQLLPNPATLSATAYFPVRTGTIDVATTTCSSPPPPTATVAASVNDGAAPLAVTFTLGASGSAAGWSVDFGDGSTLSGSGAPPATLTHTYTSADPPAFDSSGNVSFTPYVATLTIWNGCEYSTSAATEVEVSGLSSWFTVSWSNPEDPSNPCTPSSCTPLYAGTSLSFQGFAYQTANGVTGSQASSCTWSWVFGGATGSNNTSALQDPSHTYASAGTYAPTLTASCGGLTGSSSQTIPVAGCQVPGLVGESVDEANAAWTAAGFLTTPQVVGNTGQGSYTLVTSQNVGSGTVDPTCSTNIHLTVGPTPTPAP